MSSEGRDKPMTFPESEGEGTDGQGSPGIIEEKNREAEAAEADSAFEVEDDDSEEGSSGILDESDSATGLEQDAGQSRRP